ncbi:hypothetical protein VQH23_12215 [Pararoseomonas sp. SCSIO 73927]|uniref:hypothetical protein n=1 Tax=Pararoseomonas sp. SCSIO 73927 TaxID=3114537 RepID=UPI0030D60065
MKMPAALAMTMLPSLAMANCIPPWQTQFACNIPERNARVEFCRIAEPQRHPRRQEVYYTFVTGIGPAELHFEADGYIFSTKEVDTTRPSEITSGIGYPRGEYVYAFFVTEHSSRPGSVSNAEVRVYNSIDAFTNSKRDNEIARFRCQPSSVIADVANIRP